MKRSYPTRKYTFPLVFPFSTPSFPVGEGKSTTCLDKGHGNGRENGFSELMFQEEQEILPTDLYEMAAGRKIMPSSFSKFCFSGAVIMLIR